MSVFYRLKRTVRSSLASQLCAAILVEAMILSLLLWQSDPQQGLVRDNERTFVGGSSGIIAAAIAFSLLTALLAARSVERRLQDLARGSERFALEGRAIRLHEGWGDEPAIVDHGRDASLDTREQAQQIACIGPWRYKTDEPSLFWSQETFNPTNLNSAEPAQSFEDFLAGLEEKQKAIMRERFEDLEPGNERGLNLIVNRPDGTQRRCWVEARAEGNADGENRLIGTCQDVADGGAAAAQLHEALKTGPAVGPQTRSLVHDLNNLLSTTVGSLDLLEEQLPEASTERELVETALGAAMQGAELGRQLLALSRRDPAGPQTIDLSHQNDLTNVGSGAEAAAAAEADSEMLCPKNLVVLLVEDEDDVRSTVERQLGELGYTVVCASNAADALGILDDGFRIDLLFTDIVMDGDLDGVDLAKQALIKKPNLKILHTSGYTSASEQAGYEVKRLLTKPYRKSTLSSAIQSTLIDSSDEEFRL